MPFPDSAPPSTSSANIARHLGLMAAAQPNTAALKVPQGRTRAGDIDYLTLSFRELDEEVAAWCVRLKQAGIQPGDRTLVMVRQGLPLIAAVFAMFKVGAVPVVIDPGMGLKSFLACVAQAAPRALVGIPFAQLTSRIFRTAFASVSVRVSASKSIVARISRQPSAAEMRAAAPVFASASTDLAAILFTSGSTGAPKGVCYEHGMFEAQVSLIRETYSIQPGEIDLPFLPIFALFNPALGMTTIVPEIDPKRPAAFDPAKAVQAIQQERVTNSFGSPTIWRKIAEHCRRQQITLPTLKRVLCAGAAVPTELWQSSRLFLPSGQLHSPYGATEALPVTSISADEIAPSSVNGACVGRPVPGMKLRIIAINDGTLATIADTQEVPPDAIGEIIVQGPVVTKTYDQLPNVTRAAKLSGPEGVWHRMGDCGYVGPDGRLWFCGRKAERVVAAYGTLFTEPCEQVFRQHPRARRCALIGLGERGRQRAAVVVETRVKDSREARALSRELRALALQHAHTDEIKIFYFREQFPVDVRHNAKIHRLELARWARTAKGFESDPKR